MSRMRLLIVEDDPHIAELLQEGLSEDGYACDVATSASQGASLARLFPYALIILDVMLPEGADAGYVLGRELRGVGTQTPILYLSARSNIEERVTGLDAGGDDYLGKPFALRELRARVRALLRRSSGLARNVLRLPGGWQMDLGGRTVWNGNAPEEGGTTAGAAAPVQADLTRREFALLELLALHPGRAFSRQDIIERLWSGESGVEPKVIDVYVSTLRRKTAEELIDTVRGLGYRLGKMAHEW
ncbi:response regulator transcription factor [Deinococcus sp. KNUC1210]|uniref:response regulator transcription factor n=1 Tax=Deinococcus sp. KNUC1210 TaxID=2917691 RepID=UPI001EEFCD32|nr:response regulator transcription factor [Deinococcus sp. KNUC1210]ULH15361.1 response regulator transcription factor [Deinococcus sp. KNUC1210]